MLARALLSLAVVGAVSACGGASDSQGAGGDDALADGAADGSPEEDGSRVDTLPDVPLDTAPGLPPKDAVPEALDDSASEIPDTPPPACGPTCKAPSACTTGCNRCDCYAEPSWVCTAKACPGEGTGPCPTHLPLAGPVCGGRGTCVYESPCGGGKDVAKCDGLSWIVTKAPCPG